MNDMTVTTAQYVADDNGNNATVRATIDNVIITVPMDTGNRHYQAILDWVDEGNSIADAS